MDSTGELANKKRLIVLIPEGLTEYSKLAQKIVGMAQHNHCDVLYLAFVYDEATRFSVDRSMATLKALTSSDVVKTFSKLTYANDWLNTLKDIYRPGDSIVCHNEQYIRSGFLRSLPVHDFLAKQFTAHIYSVSGFYNPWQILSKKWLYSLLFWAGCLVILAGFSALEIQVDRQLQGLTRIAMMLIVLGFEFGAFWAWNHVPRI